VCAGAGWQAARLIGIDADLGLAGGVAMFTVVLLAETLLKAKESVADLTAIVFGIAVGILFGNLAFYITMLILPLEYAQDQNMVSAIRVILTVPLCYLMTMIVFRTRDRFRFVIPYVEFKKERKGPRAMLLDSSVLVDGRIADLCHTGVFESPLYVPSFVLEELQSLADSAERVKRARGQRGLGIVSQLQRSKDAEVSIYEVSEPSDEPVDRRLIALAGETDAHLCTTDGNLSRVARAQGVKVINLNELATALRPAVARGETVAVQLVRRGEEARQAVGFLDDGTMVVVESAEDRIGSEAEVEIVRYLQRSSGRIIFARLLPRPREPHAEADEPAEKKRR
jgi:uncharacterized protein YacL